MNKGGPFSGSQTFITRLRTACRRSFFPIPFQPKGHRDRSRPSPLRIRILRCPIHGSGILRWSLAGRGGKRLILGRDQPYGLYTIPPPVKSAGRQPARRTASYPTEDPVDIVAVQAHSGIDSVTERHLQMSFSGTAKRKSPASGENSEKEDAT